MARGRAVEPVGCVYALPTENVAGVGAHTAGCATRGGRGSPHQPSRLGRAGKQRAGKPLPLPRSAGNSGDRGLLKEPSAQIHLICTLHAVSLFDGSCATSFERAASVMSHYSSRDDWGLLDDFECTMHTSARQNTSQNALSYSKSCKSHKTTQLLSRDQCDCLDTKKSD